MKLTARSRDILHYRRAVRKLTKDGFEEVGGTKLRELNQGNMMHHIITDVVIGPGGKSLFIKTAPRAEA